MKLNTASPGQELPLLPRQQMNQPQLIPLLS